MFRPASELLRSASNPKVAPAEGSDLQRYADRLRIINEVHHALASSMSLDELLGLILARTFDHLRPEEGAIFLKRTGTDYYCAASRSVQPGAQAPFFSRRLVEEVAEKGLAALVTDVGLDDRFAGAQSIVSSGVRSLVAAPLQDATGSLGMMVLGSKVARREFTEDDMELLVSLASVAALRIRNVALVEEVAERRRLESELALARNIQVALLPHRLPVLQGFDLFAGNLPSRWVSGDLYEAVLRKDGTECVIFTADVSGKGMAAALLTASLEALAAAPIEAGREPHEICARVTTLLYRRTSAEKYATAFLATVNLETGVIRYVNAGHPPAILVRNDGATEWLEATGVPLGLLPDMGYTQPEVKLEPGDVLILYSDGVSEAMNPSEEEYGRERLRRVCVEHRAASPRALLDAVEQDVTRFAAGVPFADDRTLVILKRLGPSA